MMKRTLALVLVMVFFTPAVWAGAEEWPEDMSRVEIMVQRAIGGISHDRVKVRQVGNETYVSIKLKDLPRQFRTLSKEQVTEDDVFLATSVVQFLEPDFGPEDSMEFRLTPNADLIEYFYGYAVFNFGNKIKLRSVIKVRDIADAAPQIEKIKKRLKLKKNTLNLVFVEDSVNGDGLYELCTSIGPWQMLSYFCVACDG